MKARGKGGLRKSGGSDTGLVLIAVSLVIKHMSAKKKQPLLIKRAAPLLFLALPRKGSSRTATKTRSPCTKNGRKRRSISSTARKLAAMKVVSTPKTDNPHHRGRVPLS